MHIMTIASIIFETLKTTNLDLSKLIKIIMVILNALQQEGVIEQPRSVEEPLDDESQAYVRQALNTIYAEHHKGRGE